MNTTPVAVIGSGFMGRTHLEAYRSLPEARVCGMVSRGARSLDPRVPVYRSVKELVRSAEPELVSVCTPTRTHPTLVEELLRAGVDVICEKPLALDEASALPLFDLADSLGRRLHVAHVVRFIEPYRRVAELIENGRLGAIGTIRMRRAVPPPTGTGGWFADRAESGGVELDLMIHDVDFLVGCLGVPRSVYAQRRQVGRVETVLATYEFADGAIAITEASWGGVTELDYACEVAGSRGNASFGSTPKAPLIVIDSTDPEAATLSTPLPAAASQDPYRLQLRHFLAATRAGRVDPAARAQSVATLRTSTMIAASIERGEAVTVEDEVSR